MIRMDDRNLEQRADQVVTITKDGQQGTARYMVFYWPEKNLTCYYLCPGSIKLNVEGSNI